MKRTPMKRSAPMSSGGSTLRRSPMAAGGSSLQRTMPMAVGVGALRRSSELARSSGMTRAPFERAPAEADGGAQVDVKKAPAPLRRMKSKGPTMTPIRRSAKGEQCTLVIPGICRNRTDTTVWCHSNRLADGKGTGLKASDEAGCYGCYDCHAFLDGGWARFPEWSYEDVQQYFEAARAMSRIILLRKGLIAS